MEIKVYNQKGEEKGKVKLLSHVFDLPMNADLLHQAVTTQLANQRQVLAHTKDRSEVRGGGRKPWAQKGTGRARHGSRRSPIWIGGGVTFGPTKNRNFKKKMNKKMKQKAVLVALSAKVRSGALIVLDKLELEAPKTKQMAAVLNNLSDKLNIGINKSVLMVFSAKNDAAARASKNIPKTETIMAHNLNVLNILKYRYLLLTKDAISKLEEKFAK